MENSVKLGNGRPNMEPNKKANPNMIQTAKLGKENKKKLGTASVSGRAR